MGHRARHPDRKIRHAVDEDLPRLAPAKRLEEGVGVEGDAEAGPGGAGVAAGLVFRLAHGLEPLGQGQGIAVVAAGRDPVAAGGGVPGDLGPFDGAGAHDVPLLVRIVGMPRLTMRVIRASLSWAAAMLTWMPSTSPIQPRSRASVRRSGDDLLQPGPLGGIGPQHRAADAGFSELPQGSCFAVWLRSGSGRTGEGFRGPKARSHSALPDSNLPDWPHTRPTATHGDTREALGR
jgi:hypothetical protein